MKKLLKDILTGEYNPQTQKIKAKTKLVYYHEVGHHIFNKKGYNDIADFIYIFVLTITLIKPIIELIEEIYCWIYAIKKVKISNWSDEICKKQTIRKKKQNNNQ